MGDVFYLVAAYWPYLIVVLAMGVSVGWWAESRRGEREAAWLDARRDRP